MFVHVYGEERNGKRKLHSREEKILTRDCGAGRKNWKAECEVTLQDRKGKGSSLHKRSQAEESQRERQ